jgi:hypothetical protein
MYLTNKMTGHVSPQYGALTLAQFCSRSSVLFAPVVSCATGSAHIPVKLHPNIGCDPVNVCMLMSAVSLNTNSMRVTDELSLPHTLCPQAYTKNVGYGTQWINHTERSCNGST